MITENFGDQEVLASKIKEIADKIKSDKDPEQLDLLKRLIKKNVPFTLRGYFSAYLLREILNGSKPQERKPIQPKRRVQDSVTAPAPSVVREKAKVISKPIEKKPYDAVTAEPRNGKTLYLNIGKIKHLYAKDLSKLLQNELEIAREDIFFIKVHDKYSFITMNEENCDKAIAKLNGKEINGRIAQINYSNKKPIAKDETVEEKTVEAELPSTPIEATND